MIFQSWVLHYCLRENPLNMMEGKPQGEWNPWLGRKSIFLKLVRSRSRSCSCSFIFRFLSSSVLLTHCMKSSKVTTGWDVGLEGSTGLMQMFSSCTWESLGIFGSGGISTIIGLDMVRSGAAGKMSIWHWTWTDKEQVLTLGSMIGAGLTDFLSRKIVILFTLLKILAGLLWHILKTVGYFQAGDPHWSCLRWTGAG